MTSRTRLATAMSVALGCCAGAAAIAKPPADGDQTSKERLVEVALRHAVPLECVKMPCLLAIEGKPPAEGLIQALEPLGNVRAATSDDLLFEDGAVRGFLRHRAQVVDVREVTRTGGGEAQVRVAFLTSAVGSTTCSYRLRRVSGRWTVNAKETTCTF